MAPPPNRPSHQAVDAIIDAGAIGAIVYVDGEMACAGFSNLAAREPMTPRHRTWVGSIDKTYMALSAIMLFDDLDVSAARWLPQLDDRITLWHLLSHRSGLFDYMWDGETYEQLAFGPPALAAPETFVEAALRYPLRNFGQVSYSSSNYAAIDLILERETGRPLGDLLREHVFEPYGLSHTTFQAGLEPPSDVAHGYALKGGTFPAVESPRDVSRYWIDRAVAADLCDLASSSGSCSESILRWSKGVLAFARMTTRTTPLTAMAARWLVTPSNFARPATASMSSSRSQTRTAFL